MIDVMMRPSSILEPPRDTVRELDLAIAKPNHAVATFVAASGP
jgi:hypothetical protein